jgi:hypothetical protein
MAHRGDGLALERVPLGCLREWAQIRLDVGPLPEMQFDEVCPAAGLAGAAHACQLECSAVGPCAFACIASA